jgi:hypothetical protein
VDSARARDPLVAVAIGVALVAAFVFFLVFPAHDPKPNHLPVGIVGPPQVASGISAGLERDGRFEVHSYSGAAQALDAIRDRDVYGAIVIGRPPRVLVASAASPQVAAILGEAAAGIARAGGAPVVRDVVPLDPDDPRGVSLNLISLALVVTSILGALILISRVPGLAAGPRVGWLIVFGLLGGITAMLVARTGIGVLPGAFLGLAAVAALTIMATSLPAAGIIGALGEPGILVSFLIFLMLANPASGAASAPELLPDPWRTLGQLLPVGAGATAIRNTAYFDGADLARPLLVLAVWAALGALLVVLAQRRRAST